MTSNTDCPKETLGLILFFISALIYLIGVGVSIIQHSKKEEASSLLRYFLLLISLGCLEFFDKALAPHTCEFPKSRLFILAIQVLIEIIYWTRQGEINSHFQVIYAKLVYLALVFDLLFPSAVFYMSTYHGWWNILTAPIFLGIIEYDARKLNVKHPQTALVDSSSHDYVDSVAVPETTLLIKGL